VHLLVTGAAGFIGGEVCSLLQERGEQVTALDWRPAARGDRFVQADICAPDLPEILAEFRPDAVIHLAAQISVPRSVADPVEDARINLLGTVNLLEAARASGVKRFLFASSAAVYGMPEQLPLKEDAAPRPISPYGLSKWAAEAYIRQYTERYGIGHAILRLANVYGPGQTPDGEAGVVAVFCDRVRRGVAPEIHGDGEQTRDYVYVGDVAEAFLLAARSERPADTLNVGTGVPVSVSELWSLVQAAAVRSAPARASLVRGLKPVRGPARAGDIRHSYFDVARIRRAYGWRPATDLAAGLAQCLRS
jgi:UDP-glucose 4-epimerase